MSPASPAVPGGVTLTQYARDRRTLPRHRKILEDLLLSEDEVRARDAAEEADLRELAEADRAEVTIKGR